MNNCPNCEYHKARALRWRDEAYKHAGITLPEPPPECQTDAEKTAFAFGWFKAMAAESEIYKLQQEPMATLWQHGETGRTRITMPNEITDCDARWFKAADLYTSPPQRTWVGLTDDERYELRRSLLPQFLPTAEFAEEVQRLTEAKLKEKNT